MLPFCELVEERSLAASGPSDDDPERIPAVKDRLEITCVNVAFAEKLLILVGVRGAY